MFHLKGHLEARLQCIDYIYAKAIAEALTPKQNKISIMKKLLSTSFILITLAGLSSQVFGAMTPDELEKKEAYFLGYS